MRVSKRLITTSVLLLVVSACGAGEETTDTSTSTSTSTPKAITSTVGEAVNTSVEAKAIADLASRLRVPESNISVVRSQEKTWPDGSIGCPEPGMSYTQALVEGWQVLLEHESRVFDYHAAGDSEPFLCPSEDKDGGYDFVPPPGLDE